MAELAPAQLKELKLSAVITRADGTIEDQGVIASWKVEELTLLNKIKNFFRKA